MLKKLLFVLALLQALLLDIKAQEINWQREFPNAIKIAVYKEQYIAVVSKSVYKGMIGQNEAMVQTFDVNVYDYNNISPVKGILHMFSPENTSYIISDMFFDKSGTKLLIVHNLSPSMYFKMDQFDIQNPTVGTTQYPVPEKTVVDFGTQSRPTCFQSMDNKYTASYDPLGYETKINIYNSEDTSVVVYKPTEKDSKELDKNSDAYKSWIGSDPGINYTGFSASNNYLIVSRLVKTKDSKLYLHSNFVSLNHALPSYHFDNHCLNCIISSDDMTLLSNVGLTDITRKHLIRNLALYKSTIFLPGDGYVLYYQNVDRTNYPSSTGSVDANSIWKVDNNKEYFYYHSPIGNPAKMYSEIHFNSTLTAFVTLTNWSDSKTAKDIITSWKIPANLPKVKFTSGFVLPENKTYSINEEIEFSNTTYPFRRNAKYQWSFGDGSTSTDIHPSHIYSQAGTYQVKLVSTDEIGGINGDPSLLVSPEATAEIDSVIQTIIIAPNDVEEWTNQQELNTISAVPNPFSEGTTIHFGLNSPGRVVTKITNVLGEEVFSLSEDLQPNTNHYFEWNGLTRSNTQVPGGVYYCTVSSSNYTKTIPIVLAR